MTVLSELEKNLPAAYRDSLALEKEIKALETRISSFEKSLEQAEEKQKKRGDHLSGAERAERTLRKTGGRIFKSVGREKLHLENKSGGSGICRLV